MNPSPLLLLSLPGLVSSYVALDDDGFLFEEPEVPPADEASDVPLDGDGSPGLGAAPPLLQQLVEKLLEEQLTQTYTYKDVDMYGNKRSICVTRGHFGTLVRPI